MWHLDNISIETVMNVMRLLAFLLICSLGGVAWLGYFLWKEQKKPIHGPTPIADLVTRDALRILNEKANFAASSDPKTLTIRRPNIFDHLKFQAEIEERWANPSYIVHHRSRREPLGEEIIASDHAAAIKMNKAGKYD